MAPWTSTAEFKVKKTKFKSTKSGFRTSNHTVATYEQVKKKLLYFYPKKL